MPRELGDERSRYGTRSLREQLGDAIQWPGSHRFATSVILIIVVGALLLAANSGRFVGAPDLSVGACIYVGTDAAQDPTSEQPIGTPDVVAGVVLAGGAQRADCTASHGHEVSLRIDLLAPGFLRDSAGPACQAAFAGYVGRDRSGSRYTTFAVLPGPGDPSTSVGLCLVARADGRWMDHPARGSGE